MRQFANAECIFCASPSSPTGEHVVPAWLIKTFGLEEGPFSVWEGQIPQRARDGSVRRYSALPGAKLPMCARHNHILAQRFEQPIRTFKDRIFQPDLGLFDSHEIPALASWILKTWLLLAHPLARFADGVRREREWLAAPDAVWSWMAEGREPPHGLSVWLWRRDDARQASEPVTVTLPEVVHDGVTERFLSYELGIRNVEVALAYHPGWPIEHPLESDRRAVRLWPLPDRGPLDIAGLPSVPAGTSGWISDGPTIRFAPGAYARQALPALPSGLTECCDVQVLADLGIISITG